MSAVLTMRLSGGRNAAHAEQNTFTNAYVARRVAYFDRDGVDATEDPMLLEGQVESRIALPLRPLSGKRLHAHSVGPEALTMQKDVSPRRRAWTHMNVPRILTGLAQPKSSNSGERSTLLGPSPCLTTATHGGSTGLDPSGFDDRGH